MYAYAVCLCIRRAVRFLSPNVQNEGKYTLIELVVAFSMHDYTIIRHRSQTYPQAHPWIAFLYAAVHIIANDYTIILPTVCSKDPDWLAIVSRLCYGGWFAYGHTSTLRMGGTHCSGSEQVIVNLKHNRRPFRQHHHQQHTPLQTTTTQVVTTHYHGLYDRWYHHYTTTTTSTMLVSASATPVTTTMIRYQQRNAHEAFFHPTQQQWPQHRCKHKTRSKRQFWHTPPSHLHRPAKTRMDTSTLCDQSPVSCNHGALPTTTRSPESSPTWPHTDTTTYSAPPITITHHLKKQHKLRTWIRLTGLGLHCFLFIKFQFPYL